MDAMLYPNSWTMGGKKNFIVEAIDLAKPVFQKSGFQATRLEDVIASLDISKSKFFNYFGSMHGLMELVLYHELLQCYSFVYEKVQRINKFQELMEKVLYFRHDYIAQNEVLRQYFEGKKYLTPRFDNLKSTIKEAEEEFLQRIVEKFNCSEEEIWCFKHYITKDT